MGSSTARDLAACLLLHAYVAAAFGPQPASPVFDTPLYLYSSAVNKDVALLVASPSLYNINHPGSYTRVYSEPVAFAAARLVPGVADVALRAYWSEERNDIQTSNWDMVTINEHGGKSCYQCNGY